MRERACGGVGGAGQASSFGGNGLLRTLTHKYFGLYPVAWEKNPGRAFAGPHNPAT